jgi:hypothetical protein
VGHRVVARRIPIPVMVSSRCSKLSIPFEWSSFPLNPDQEPVPIGAQIWPTVLYSYTPIVRELQLARARVEWKR